MKDRNTEIREAIEAGNRALDALDEAMGHLKTAGAWACGTCWEAAFSAAC